MSVIKRFGILCILASSRKADVLCFCCLERLKDLLSKLVDMIIRGPSKPAKV